MDSWAGGFDRRLFLYLESSRGFLDRMEAVVSMTAMRFRYSYCKAVMFDMDGLMIDSERLYRKAWLIACSDLAVSCSDAVYWQLIGRNWPEARQILFSSLGEAWPVDAVSERAGEQYERLLSETSNLAKPGLLALLDWLDDNAVPWGVGSSSSEKGVRDKLERIGIWNRARAVVCGDHVSHGKPHPETYLRLANKLGAEPRSCLALEDSANGIRAASAAGTVTVMIPDLIEPSEEISALCDGVYPSLESLLL